MVDLRRGRRAHHALPQVSEARPESAGFRMNPGEMTHSNYRLVKILLWAFLLVWLLFTLFPLYFMLITSLKPVEEINRMIPTFWPQTMKVNNYAGIFADPGSLQSLIDSLIVSISNTLLSLFLGTLAGYALARWVRGLVGENRAVWLLSNRM